MIEKVLYAEVILPLAFGNSLTYLVPDALKGIIKVGCRVNVPLGMNRHYTGIVCKLHQTRPEGYSLKEITNLIDNRPILLEKQLLLWQWIADYYICSPGEVMNAALPAGLKEEDAYKPKTLPYLRLNKKYLEETEALTSLKKELGRAKKQIEALDLFVSMTTDHKKESHEISKQAFLEEQAVSPAILKALTEKGIIEILYKEISRLKSFEEVTDELHPLNNPQKEAMSSIKDGWNNHDICLLHGVTSSGKTEIYIHLIQEALKEGKQVLYLLPEIALTTQITDRLKRIFGNKLGVYHSKFSPAERVEIWNNLLYEEGYEVIVGVRSSVFLPFSHLGLVIVDEEHETSYKQQDPAPRYHARNVALVLAKMFGAKALLGSATPSIESYNKAHEGKYGLVELRTRYQDQPLPKIIPVNVKELRRKKIMKSLFSPLLLEKMQQAFSEKEQVILFQNRRGYAPVIACKECGWTPHCSRCEVTLTYHKQSGKLRCHYCGQEQSIPPVCPQCGKKTLEIRGFGTEKVEEILENTFPDIRIARMDMDTMSNRQSYEQLIRDFEQQKIDVLIGTQMLTKGLDFDHVNVVGILNADTMMNFPDFRSHERAFQLMTQVSGRAGRKNKKGCVIIQTTEPENIIIQDVIKNDFWDVYVQEMKERALFSYPPYSYLIDIWFKHRDLNTVQQAAGQYAKWISEMLPESVYGPFPPAVSRVKNLYLQKLTLKISPQLSLKKIKDYLCRAQEALRKNASFRSIIMFFDVDPV